MSRSVCVSHLSPWQLVTCGREAETPFELCPGSLLVAGAYKFRCCVVLAIATYFGRLLVSDV